MNTLLELRERSLKLTTKLASLPPLVARLTLAIVFVQSGWGKLHNLAGVTDYFTQLGIPYPALQAPFVSAMELLCGIALGLGLLTRLASLPIIVMMIVATLTARAEDLHSVSDLLGFIEYLYLVLAGWLVIVGPGQISVDHFLLGRMGKNRLTRP